MKSKLFGCLSAALLGAALALPTPAMANVCSAQGRTKFSPLMETVPLDIRRSLLRQHGNFALAYSVTFQPGLEHFGDEAGFLSYKTVGNTALVLSNPVAAPAKRGALINRFVEEKGDVCFWQISRPVAEILAGLGCSINEMGTESHINLAELPFCRIRCLQSEIYVGRTIACSTADTPHANARQRH